MNELKLPEQLKGPWDHALILTYGVHIPFLENALWRQFGARCRNKVILADGQSYLDACIEYARGGLVRHLNQQYVVEGILTPHAAHGKVIMLVNPDRGRLLVGSGNLSLQGYASGGELFTSYEYTANMAASVNPFLVIRELVDGLIERGYVAGFARKRIHDLWEATPWLFQSPIEGWNPVRHNLSQSFLSQLQQLITEPVQELWILSPFYDERAHALEQMLSTFQPQSMALLLQPGSTSVDPDALQQVINRCQNHCQVYAVKKGTGTLFLHAKLYLFKLADRAVCLQGSPNLSQVAMLLAVPQGNIEIANVLTGPRDAFDHLLQPLDMQPASIDTLDLSYQSEKKPHQVGMQTWRLTGGQWENGRLLLRFQGTLPDLQGASLCVDGHAFPLVVYNEGVHELELELAAEAMHLLQRPVAVELCWGDDEATKSNPIFVCNRAALDAAVLDTGEEEVVDRFGDLNLDDEEFQRLLLELDSSLVFDRTSVWQLAGRNVSAETDQEDEALRLDYGDIDYDMLRRHPRIQQYLGKKKGGPQYNRTRLQIVLAAITDHFSGLLETSLEDQKVIIRAIADLDDDDQGEEDRDQQQDAKERRRLSQVQRISRILKGFIRRYLRGIRSRDFQELAGFEVVVQNYIIFAHLLWRLFAKDWVEPEFVIESLLKTWAFFWGGLTSESYLDGLLEPDRTQAQGWLREHHADAVLLAALYYGAYLTRTEGWIAQRLALRDFWRHLLSKPPFAMTTQILEETWHAIGHLLPYEPPTPVAIVDELTQLASFDTRTAFCQTLGKIYGFPPGSCSFDDRCRVYRPSLGRPDTVSCLVIQVNDALSNKDTAIAILEAWMRFEEQSYYRIQEAGTDGLLFYDIHNQQGLYYSPALEVELQRLSSRDTAWTDSLARLASLARDLELEIRSLSPKREPSFVDDEASLS